MFPYTLCQYALCTFPTLLSQSDDRLTCVLSGTSSRTTDTEPCCKKRTTQLRQIRGSFRKGRPPQPVRRVLQALESRRPGIDPFRAGGPKWIYTRSTGFQFKPMFVANILNLVFVLCVCVCVCAWSLSRALDDAVLSHSEKAYRSHYKSGLV